MLFQRHFRRIVRLAVSLAGLTVGLPSSAQNNEMRAMWVDAWGTGFLNASQVTQLIADCRTYNYNAIIVQMRRRGDAFYTPGITGNDPKTTAIASNFDALQDILTKARSGSPRIEVHCWVTTHVIWSSTTPPPQLGHVFNLHPEYLMRDATGATYLAEGYYLDPGHPEATLWNYVMATNIVRRYDVDGFHWDYIRYPQQDSGYNPTAITRYNAEFGLTGQPAPADAQFSNWRRRQVTDFLRWVNSDLLAIRSNLVISAAVFGSRTDAFNARFQDWAAWNNEGILDICMPMGYTSDNGIFQARVDDAFNHQGVRRVYQGQGAYLNTKENTIAQLNYIRGKPLSGSVLYSYRVPNSGTVDRAGTLTYLRNNFQPTWVDVPAVPWKASPTTGIVRGTVTRQVGGAPVYNATLTISTAPGRTQRTEPHGKFAFFETAPGTYTVGASAADLGMVTTNITVTAGMNMAISLMLPPDSTPPVISGVGTSNLTDTSVTIRWTTDEKANTTVDYGPTIAYGSTVSNATLTLNHAIGLTGLTPNTTYHYRVRSRNVSGLQATSGNFTFKSNPPGVVNDVIVESRLPGGGLNTDPPYADLGFANSTLKSSAPSLSGSAEQGSRYASSGTPSFTIRPTLPVAGGVYDVFLTHGAAASISDDVIVAVGQTGCTGLPTSTTMFREPGGNTWELLGRMTANPGVTMPTLTFTRSSGELSGSSRMYSDAIKFVFVPPPQPPAITNQPSNLVVNQGANATFNVGVTGDTPLSYQWRFAGLNLADAIGSSYTRLNVQPAHEGEYSVVVTNAAGSVTSSVALLTIRVPPSLVEQPQSQTVFAGQDATFFVTVEGTEPFSYQWRLNGTSIPGATAGSYTRFHAGTNDAGGYSVVVTNLAGNITSASASLTVLLPHPPGLEVSSLLPDGRVQLRFSGEVGLPFAIDVSSNLREWFELWSGLLTVSPSDFVDDSVVTNTGSRFYRARQ